MPMLLFGLFGLTGISMFVLFVFIGPFFSITALNTLFGLGIELTLGTWFAMFWVHLALLPKSYRTEVSKPKTK